MLNAPYLNVNTNLLTLRWERYVSAYTAIRHSDLPQQTIIKQLYLR